MNPDEALTSLAYRSGELLLSQIPAPGTPDGEYYWRVMACDALRCSDWSDVWHLTVTSVVVETVQTGSQEESHNETQTPLLSIELFSDLAEQQSIYESATLVGEESQNDEESTEVGGNPNTKTSGDLQEVNNNLTSENEETI